MSERFEDMLTGGHPNSLGRTIEVVDCVLADPNRFEELFACYKSVDDVIRLRTSNAMKRVVAENHSLLVPYIDRFIEEVGALDQASAQWTLAQLFDRLSTDMTADQTNQALGILKRNLAHHTDWIVLKNTAATLGKWAVSDPELAQWLRPHLEKLAKDPLKTVSGQARKSLTMLGLL